jgi:hypothetical protein
MRILSDREFRLFIALGAYSTESRYEINRPNFRLIDGPELSRFSTRAL